jgi:hypothetical protein
MFTHLSGWKSRVEIDQRAREGRLRQEWREAPHENECVSIPVTFWSVLGLVAQTFESRLKPPHSLGYSEPQSRPITSRLSPRVLIWKGIRAKIRREPPKASLNRKGAGAETRFIAAPETLRAAASGGHPAAPKLALNRLSLLTRSVAGMSGACSVHTTSDPGKS